MPNQYAASLLLIGSPRRLPASIATGQTLVANASGGFDAATPSGGGGELSMPPQIGTGTQGPLGISGWQTGGRAIGGSAANSDNRAIAMLHYYRSQRDIIGLSLNVQTAGDAGAEARLALYGADGSDGDPGTLTKDGGVVSLSTTGTKMATFTAIRPSAGYYWVVIFVKTGGTSNPALAAPNAMTFQIGPINMASNNSVSFSHLFASPTYPVSAAPDPAPTMLPRDFASSTGGAIYLGMELS